MGAPRASVWRVTRALPQPALGGLFRFLGGVDDFDAAGLAAAAGVNLRLDHRLAAQFLGSLPGRRRRNRQVARRRGDAVADEKLFGLVFVQFHS